VDWVEKGAVTPIKNQGMCGGAVLFATLGGVEGLSKVATGTLQTFSEQQLIDCVFGCTGSQATEGYNYYKTHRKCLFT
jgi:C1A family cysteine protease